MCPSHTSLAEKKRRSGIGGAPEIHVGVRCYCTTMVNVVGVPVTLPEVAFTVIV